MKKSKQNANIVCTGQDFDLRLPQAIAGLERELRDVVVLVDVLGYTQKKASVTLHVTEADLKKRLGQARELLSAFILRNPKA